ncbi:MAG: universal stress protein [Alphaproteobacteria bacterium]|nr:universal stress protein [Alphaproteobacteria bacterium]
MAPARKFLVIADGSEESRTAAYFAARRARNTGARVAILAVAQTQGGFEHWLGVGETMRAEAVEQAETDLESLAEDVEGVTEVRPELILKEGDLLTELKALVERDEEIAILVLGASEESEPGVLVGALAKGKGLFGDRRIPVTVVPGGLSKDQLKALA